jgi:hypothetical protein
MPVRPILLVINNTYAISLKPDKKAKRLPALNAGTSKATLFCKATALSRLINVPMKHPIIMAPCSPAALPGNANHPMRNRPVTIPVSAESIARGKRYGAGLDMVNVSKNYYI